MQHRKMCPQINDAEQILDSDDESSGEEVIMGCKFGGESALTSQLGNFLASASRKRRRNRQRRLCVIWMVNVSPSCSEFSREVERTYSGKILTLEHVDAVAQSETVVRGCDIKDKTVSCHDSGNRYGAAFVGHRAGGSRGRGGRGRGDEKAKGKSDEKLERERQ